jgi:hypothetical protein
MPANNQYQNLEGCTRDLARYDTMIKYFEDDSDRVSANVKYLNAISKSLDLIALRNPKETAPEFWLAPENYKKRIDKLLAKDKKKNVQNLRGKLNSIEASREEKKASILSQWLGD